MTQYQEICHSIPSERIDHGVYQNLLEAIDLKISLGRHQYDQIVQLQARLSAQHDVTTTLMAQRDSQLTIDIAEATKRDSELMRGIAAVTMIFFPATFVATFFSMVFFHVGDEASVRLMVDRQIWMYPVVTVPLTIFIAAWYFAWTLGWTWKTILEAYRVQRK
jgi:Mg2+ and Co2+ transporter CorA